MPDVIIVGGGVSGFSCAIASARRGLAVTVLEKMDRVLKKLLVTGNGRCNLASESFSLDHYHGSCTDLAGQVFGAVTPDDIESFWREIGIEYCAEKGRYYPRSLQASSVSNALRREAERLGVAVMTSCPVRAIVPQEQGGFEVVYQNADTGHKEKVFAPSVVLTAGGKASPQLGSAGEGRELWNKMGLSSTKLRPAICRILADSPYLSELAGQKVWGILSLWSEREKAAEEEGEVLFTKEGLSGPPVLALSRKAGDLLEEGKEALLQLDLVPEKNSGQLFGHLTERFFALSHLSLSEALEGYLVKRVIGPLLKSAELSKNHPAGRMTKQETGKLAKIMKAWTFPVRALDSFRDAQVTVGGIDGESLTDHLESRTYRGLFAAGEVLDLDGDCGGYNLMFAVASGVYAAGFLGDKR